MPHNEIPNDENKDSAGSSLSSVASLRQHQENEIATDSTNSSLRSDEVFEEFINAEGFPAQPYYLPIVIPPEPTLDELLRRVSGEDDLLNVESLKLRVISYMVSLSRLSCFTPKLTSLNLEGSVLSSIRDLGYGLTHLKYLNVSNCGLSSLDGTNGISTVEVLIADGNMIEIVNPIGNLPLLKKLSLKDNRIRNLGLLTFLGLCPLLQEVNLEGNSVTTNTMYRIEIYKNVKSLELLDGVPFEFNTSSDEIASSSTGSEATSSLSEEGLSERESDVEFDNNVVRTSIKERPATSHGTCYITIQKELQRPHSSDCGTEKILLTSGGPVCGSIVTAARNLRKQERKNAWDYSSSSSGSLSSSEYSYDKTFPNQLSQTPVDLELGVVGANTPSTSETESNSSLKEIARKWRTECQRRKNCSTEK